MSILKLLKSSNPEDLNKLHRKLSSRAKKNVKESVAEYNNDRTVREEQVGNRKDKVTKKDVTKVAKIPIPFQREVVQSASAFLFSSPVNISPKEPNNLSQIILDLWDEDLRLNSLLLKFAEAVKSETEATIIFYEVKKSDGIKLKSRLLTSKDGKYYPYFDKYGDLVAFGWEYEVTENKKKKKYLYVYTEEHIYSYKKESDNWGINEKPRVNLFKKIPIVYLSQEKPEWEYVKEMIDRYENSFSKTCDTNDYFASPMYKAKGGIKSAPKKDETGRIVKLDVIETDKGNIIESDLDYLTWERAPEALKLEFETNENLIYSLTSTPKISFESVKGLGNLSGVALKLMFFKSILKAKRDEGDYSVVVKRLLSIVKSAVKNILHVKEKNNDTSFKIEFTSVLPENLKEVIETLVKATGGKAVLTQKTAFNLNPMVEDKEGEEKQFKLENNVSEPTK